MAKATKINFTWGMAQEILNQLGYLQVTGFMLDTYTELGLTRAEFLCILHLARRHYNSPEGKADPSAGTIAKEMGYSHSNSVRLLAKSLEAKKMLKITRVSGRPSIYDASPFALAAFELWKKKTLTMGCEGQPSTLTMGCESTLTMGCEGPSQPIVTEEKKKKRKRKEGGKTMNPQTVTFDDLEPAPRTDPETLAQATVGRNWSVPLEAGGDEAWQDGPVNAFAALVGLNTLYLPKKKRREWAQALKQLAGRWSTEERVITPDDVMEAIKALPDSQFGWKTFTSPYEAGFENALAILILGVEPEQPPVIYGIEVKHE